MENILLIFICLLLGLFFQKIKDLPPYSYKTLNFFVTYISMPTLGLYYIPKIQINVQLLYPLSIAWLGFLFSFVFFYVLGKKLAWSNKLIGCLIITTGLGNTAFIGLPVIQALYGDEGMKTALVVDQTGTFVVMSTLGVITGAFFSKGNSSIKGILAKIVVFPPFIIFILACVLNVLQIDFPFIVQIAFQKLGATVIPIALVSVGMQLKVYTRTKHWSFLILGLFFKLIITPAIFFIFYKKVLQQNTLQIDVSIMQAAMAPMIMGAIIASNYGLKPKLCSMMIGIGIPLSFFTLAIWYFILKFF